MFSTDFLERWSKFLSLINETAKFLAVGVIALIATASVVAPDRVGKRLAQLRIAVLEAGPFKIAFAAEAEKSSSSMLAISEALTEAQIRLTEMAAATKQQEKPEIKFAIDHLLAAQKDIDKQSASLKHTANNVGLQQTTNLETGWLYVGVFSESGKPVSPSNRLDLKNASIGTDKQIKELVLRFDASIVSNGDNCTKIDLSDFIPPAHDEQYAVLRASPNALQVLSTKACPSIGGNRVVYAQITIPRDRIRFSSFSNLP